MTALLLTAHRVLMGVYLCLPPLAVAWAISVSWRGRARRPAGSLRSLIVTFGTGFLIGAVLVVVYGRVTAATPRIGEMFIAGYFASAMLLLLKLLDHGLIWVLERMLRTRLAPRPVPRLVLHPATVDAATAASPAGEEASAPAPPVPVRTRRGLTSPDRAPFRALFGQVVRLVLVFIIAIPYAMSCVLIYRPRLKPTTDPYDQLGYRFERVSFDSVDGTGLVGWWIPAPARPLALRQSDTWGRRTVIICPGIAGGKSSYLTLARNFPSAGLNVLIFDPRAHGESGGRITSFGDIERRDVLGAVRWLRQAHPRSSARIFGVGSDTGAGALIAAAADPSDEGAAIDALAVYSPFDTFGHLAASAAGRYFLPPVGWLLMHVAVPLSSLQTGRDLAHFSPAHLVDRLWPRPILVIHGVDDEVIPFELGQALYDAASPPKRHLWPTRQSHADVLGDEDIQQQVIDFLQTAEDVPVI